MWSLKCKWWSVECGVRTFPHRLGDATGKPETRDKTHVCRKTQISYEASCNFNIFDTLANRFECHKVPRLPRKTTLQPAWKPSERRGFAASPIDAATPQENQTHETRHVGAEKQAFRTRCPPIFTPRQPRVPDSRPSGSCTPNSLKFKPSGF